jgi:hypothetical protein
VTILKNRGKFGVKLSNGSLTGALGNLQKRKSDIALTAFFMKVRSDFEKRNGGFTEKCSCP